MNAVATGMRIRSEIAEPANASSGQAQDYARLADAVTGSQGLLHACEKLFDNFAKQHKLTPAVARRLQLEGYRV